MSTILEVRALLTQHTCVAIFDYVIAEYLWDFESKLAAAGTCGNLEVVKYLHSIGVDMIYFMDCAFRAIKYNHADILKYVLSIGVDFEDDLNIIFTHAANFGHVEILKCLISVGANIQTDDYDLVEIAAEKGHLKLMKYLVDVCDDEDLDTALIIAAREGHLNLVMYLVSVGAAVTKLSIRLAKRNGHKDVVEYLNSFKE